VDNVNGFPPPSDLEFAVLFTPIEAKEDISHWIGFLMRGEPVDPPPPTRPPPLRGTNEGERLLSCWNEAKAKVSVPD
jgi:hypothetical protein